MQSFREEVNKLRNDLERLVLKLQDLDSEEEYTEQQQAYFENLTNKMEDLYREVRDDIRYDRLPQPYEEQEARVRCIDCEHLRTMLTQGKHLPGAICASPIWKELGRAPHVVEHDLYEPIRCDHFEKKEGKHDGTNN